MSMKILNTSFVCRKDGVEVYEIVCPTRDGLCGLCTVSIPDMKMADELIDLLYRMELFFPSPCLQQSLSRSWTAGSFAVCCCLFWDPKSELMARVPCVPYRALARLASPQSWRIKAQPPLLGSAWQFWVPMAEFLLQGAPEFQSWIPLAAESVQCNTHSALHVLHGSLGLNISSLKAPNSMFSNVTSVKFRLWCYNANATREAFPFWATLHEFHWILHILSLTDELLIWTSN